MDDQGSVKGQQGRGLMLHGVALYRGADPSVAAKSKARSRGAHAPKTDLAITDVVVTALSTHDVVVAGGAAPGGALGVGERLVVDLAGIGERAATVIAVDQPGYRLAFVAPLSPAELALARRFDGALDDEPQQHDNDAAAGLAVMVPPYPEPVVGKYAGAVRVLLAAGLAAGAWAAVLGLIRLLQS
jgi:hypothetical protein